LELLGLGEEASAVRGTPRKTARASLLAEADPALSRVVGEVREGLEGTLRLLQEALGERDAETPDRPEERR
jgi:hypothetical protein